MIQALARCCALTALLAGAGSPAGAWVLKVCADPDAPPFSNRDGTGIDNQIARLIAGDLGAELETVWMADHRAATLRRHLQTGDCDLAFSVMDGQRGFLTTHAYYRTGYVFVTMGQGVMPASLDDPALKGLRVGVAGDPQHLAPPAVSLANRGMIENLHYFPAARLDDQTTAAMTGALRDGQIDLAVMWGPVAGAIAAREGGLVLAPVTPEIDMPFIPMVAAFTMGVRPDDEALRDRIDVALADQWVAVQQVLAKASVPILPLPRPSLTAEVTQ